VNPIRNILYFKKKRISNGARITITSLQNKIPINPARVKKAVLGVVSGGHKEKNRLINICFVTDRRIKNLNAKYLKHNYATDVIAFNLSENSGLFPVADIVVSVDTAIRNSRVFNTTPVYELMFYVVHGVLHILGFNDKTSRQRESMNKRAAVILNKLNIKPHKICPSIKQKQL